MIHDTMTHIIYTYICVIIHRHIQSQFEAITVIMMMKFAVKCTIAMRFVRKVFQFPRRFSFWVKKIRTNIMCWKRRIVIQSNRKTNIIIITFIACSTAFYSKNWTNYIFVFMSSTLSLFGTLTSLQRWLINIIYLSI